ncbi:MAG: JmjC domain-containing protein [Vicinamibacterales bacterium]
MDCFDDLLAPLDRARFFAEHWGRQSIVIAGDRRKFGRLPGVAELPAMLAGRLSPERWTAGPFSSAQVTFIDRHGATQRLTAPSTMWGSLYNAGFSICLGPVDRTHPELVRFVGAFSDTTPYAGSIVTTCYLTPPGSGYVMHFDVQHNFLLQVSGEKHWTYGSRPAVADPVIGMSAPEVAAPAFQKQSAALGVLVAAPADTGLREAVLREGDILYMPPGVWHHGRTEESHSFHYTLTFEPMWPWAVLKSFLTRQLVQQSSWRADLRYPLESGAPRQSELVAQALEDLRTAIARVTPDELAQLYLTTQATPGLTLFAGKGV